MTKSPQQTARQVIKWFLFGLVFGAIVTYSVVLNIIWCSLGTFTKEEFVSELPLNNYDRHDTKPEWTDEGLIEVFVRCSV